MIDAGEVIGRFISGRQRRDLDSDRMLSFALARAIEIIGEASSKVSRETRDTTPAVPWRNATDMRNRMIHAYFHVDNDILWKTATEEVPALLASLRPLVERE